MPTAFYPIGTPGQKWEAAERKEWVELVGKVKREYKVDVLDRLDALKGNLPASHEITSYGALTMDPARYPLFAIRPVTFDAKKPTVLVTGGVHGYETSGVKGALLFAETQLPKYRDMFNIVVMPCICPWGYETISRWTAVALDPNRHFIADSPAEECAKAMAFIQGLGTTFKVHFDLHETTDTDESEFSPAKAARDGGVYEPSEIPDGFYLVGGSEEPALDWHNAMIDAVRPVTHIAPADKKGNLIDVPIQSEGVLFLAGRTLGLCGGHLCLKYSTTTEVYPDSPKANGDICNRAQVACVVAGLDFLVEKDIVKTLI